jgi:hypothetical protein
MLYLVAQLHQYDTDCGLPVKRHRTAAHHNSENIAACIAHTDMDAGNATVMDSLMSKGVHQMMGSGWRDQESHEDVFDAEAGGWVDRKASVTPHSLRAPCS